MTTKLTREFRFAWRGVPLPSSSANSWAGWGGSLQPAIQLALQLTVSGTVRQPSGYICNIKALDDSLRTAVNRVAATPSADLSFDQLLRRIGNEIPASFALAGTELAGVNFLALSMWLSPQLSLYFSWEEAEMLTLTQQFEFSAAHRLNCPELTAAENRATFGKCNNPHGHGHNYVVEVSVGVTEQTAAAFPAGSLEKFESTVKRVVIDRFDHQHLNEDVAEFRELNPSVENIADVCFRLLEPELLPLRLVNVRVYETPKTWADRGA
jgi:6-pyruvoyltetrahydropterin/6-carboxytetrahydropterin synthase